MKADNIMLAVITVFALVFLMAIIGTVYLLILEL